MLLLNLPALQANRFRLPLDDPSLDAVRIAAAKILNSQPPSVLDKDGMAASGNKHDYWSLGPYWWPNPDTPDGLPYVRRDGEVNPENDRTDRPSLQRMTDGVEVLTLAFFYLGDECYAATAAQWLRIWFLNSATRMNPHLEFGQAIPGYCEGRGIGIIDTHYARLLPDLLTLLEGSKSWSEEDSGRIRAWFGDYVAWLLISDHGRDEANEHNNHGTWFDVQAALFALTAGREDMALEILQAVPEKRFAPHVAPDGSQPYELARTRSFSYSCLNLLGFFDLATLGEHIGVELWDWQGAQGQSLKSALDFLAVYADSAKEWPYQQIVPDSKANLFQLLRRTPEGYRDEAWRRAFTHLDRAEADFHWVRLLWPVAV